MRIYLDCCCLNRPFDDLRQERVRADANAVTAILTGIKANDWQLVTSEILEFELSRMGDVGRREACLIMLHLAHDRVAVDAAVRGQTQRLISLGFDTLDAAHLASAIVASADVFLTVDDALLRRAGRLGQAVGVQVNSPLPWLREQAAGTKT